MAEGPFEESVMRLDLYFVAAHRADIAALVLHFALACTEDGGFGARIMAQVENVLGDSAASFMRVLCFGQSVKIYGQPEGGWRLFLMARWIPPVVGGIGSAFARRPSERKPS
ncbi:hypothetical protein [Paraburkholderia sp.]|uniref:hypothetical protein n=1 Tax=Paraburkholderia sp. TaxID=1926495 RepID=UPI0025D8A9FD|nr:hypothetical protein [Paraburkholderia sp.]